MSVQFNPSLGATIRRFLIIMLVLGFFLICMKITEGSIWQQRIFALIPAGMAVMLFVRYWRRWRSMRKRVARWEMRMLRAWRKFWAPAPIVEMLHGIGAAIGLFSSALSIAGWPVLGGFGLQATMGLFMAAGVCDIALRTTRVLKAAWAPVAGKIWSASIGVALTALTACLAKQLIQNLSHIDPKYFTEFIVVLTACLAPFVYMMAFAVILSLYAMFQIIVFGLVAFVGAFYGQARPLFPKKWYQRVRLFWYRIRMGKKPPGEVVPSSGPLSQGEISLLASPISTVAVVYALITILQSTVQVFPHAQPILARAMVAIEYRQGGACRNIGREVRLAYMDDGLVSIATWNGVSYEFEVKKCEYEEAGTAPDPAAGHPGA